jgi:3',5'-cyclic AMP phosphodiesterase CpdA
MLTLRHWIWIGAGTALLIVGVNFAIFSAYPFVRWTEDFFPGRAPDAVLEPRAWTTTVDSVAFAVLGDGGSGGRNAMDVARQMVAAYQENPYGVVVHVGDLSYYGSIADRFEEVFEEPYGPLLDAGVEFEIAIGNHELEEAISPEADKEIAETLRIAGEQGSFYKATHGPVDFFILDSSTPLITGNASEEQLAWLNEELAASTATWKVAALHHPPYASGPKRGSNLPVREAVEPLFVKYGVDLVLTGHDHFYERSQPQQGIVYVVTGGGAKISDIGSSDFTAVSAKTLQFMLVEVDGATMHVRSIDEQGGIVDDFTLSKG